MSLYIATTPLSLYHLPHFVYKHLSEMSYGSLPCAIVKAVQLSSLSILHILPFSLDLMLSQLAAFLTCYCPLSVSIQGQSSDARSSREDLMACNHHILLSPITGAPRRRSKLDMVPFQDVHSDKFLYVLPFDIGFEKIQWLILVYICLHFS